MRIAVLATLYAGALIGGVWLGGGCKAGTVQGEAPSSAKPVKPYEPPDERIVFFAPGRAEISSSDGFFALGYVSALLDGDPGLHVLIVGHAANEASPTFARDLSFRRARSVRQILASHGVGPGRMLLAAPREQQRALRPALNQRADVYLYDPLQDEISQRLGYQVELRGE